MAWYQTGDKPSPEPMLTHFYWRSPVPPAFSEVVVDKKNQFCISLASSVLSLSCSEISPTFFKIRLPQIKSTDNVPMSCGDFIRSRRNPRPRCAWLTGPEPRSGMREPPSGSMQLQKLQFESVIYGNPEHSNWHQSFPMHIWLFLAQCGIPAGFIKTMQVEEMQNTKNISIFCRVKPKSGEKK